MVKNANGKSVPLKIEITPKTSIEEFANKCVIACHDSPAGIIKVSLPAYANKSVICNTQATLFVLENGVFLFPNTWRNDEGHPNAFGVTSYALRVMLKKGSMVEVALYSSSSELLNKDTPTSAIDYPIEAFLTAESVHEFWVKHPVPVWSKDDDISYMRYPFWVYLSHIIRRLYSDKMRAIK